MGSHAADSAALSPTQGRLCILVASLLWSTSSVFTKVLTQPTMFGLHDPPIEPLQISFYRALFAGAVLLPFLRRGDVSFRPVMLPMVVCFAVMNAAFVSALSLGTAANAIVLQYTAPMWMVLGCVWWLGEKVDRASLTALGIGLIGVVIIVVGGWDGEQLPAVRLGLLAGLAYAGVMLSLRVLAGSSPLWLTCINFLFSAAVLVPVTYALPMPDGPQMAVLFVYGAVQMTVPYWLVARGVRSVSPQEAGTITLVEPFLNPLWAYLVVGEEPRTYSLIGGAFIVGALAWRYWPRKD
jgi:drug/metabolite transporter (DMT)-like permease